MKSPAIRSIPVKQLYAMLDQGCFAIPKLQRAFVWNGRKAAMLFDSVYQGMPIGSLTIWDTSKKNKNLLRHTLHILPGFNERNTSVWFILDGQQRLSVLYHAAKGGEKKNGSHQTVYFDRIVFRVTDGEENPRFQYRKPVRGEWVSLPHILSPSWRNHLKGLTQGQLNRAGKCRQLLQKYKVPIIRVKSNSIDEARELFIRINSQGTPLSAADRVFAKAAEFDLRQSAEDTWQRLPSDFQGVRYEMSLQTLALIGGVKDVGERAFETVVKQWDKKISKDPKARTQFENQWDKQRKAILRAIDCLRHYFRVLDDGLLPSEYMISTLAVFFYYRNNAQPNALQLRELRKWFWATAVGQRYSGRGFRQNILADAGFFHKLATTKTARFVFDDKVDQAELRRAAYGQRSSIADALYCLLISQKPAYLTNGQPMLVAEYASPANRKHKHHIFPKQLLKNNGVSHKQANSIVNLCFISGEENSKFGASKPSTYLDGYKNRKHFAKVMKSHLIPYDGNSGLWDKNVALGHKTFIKARTRELCKAFEKQAGMKLFRAE